MIGEDMERPTIDALREATGISQSYASMILSGTRPPSRALAIHILRQTGWRHSLLDGLTDDQIETLETIEPWKASRPTAQASVA